MKLRRFILPVLFGAVLTSCNMPNPGDTNINNHHDDDDEDENINEEVYEDVKEVFEELDMSPEQAQEYVDGINSYIEAHKEEERNTSYTIEAIAADNKKQSGYAKIEMNKQDYKFKISSWYLVENKGSKIKTDYERGVWKGTDKVEGYETFMQGVPATFEKSYATDEEGTTKFYNMILPPKESDVGALVTDLCGFNITDLSTALLGILKHPENVPEEFGTFETKVTANNNGDLKAILYTNIGESDDDNVQVNGKFEFKNNRLVYAYGKGLVDEYKGTLKLKLNYDVPNITYPEIL